MARPTLRLGFLLLLVSTVRLEATKSPRGVRGSSFYSGIVANDASLNLTRNLQGKNDKNNNKDEEEIAEDKNAEVDGDQEVQLEEAFETPEPTLEPTNEPSSLANDPDAESDKEQDLELETIPDVEDEQAAETEAPRPDVEPAETTAPEEIVEDPSEEETSNPVALPTVTPTSAPESNYADTVSPTEAPTFTFVTDDAHMVNLAPFTIDINYEETILEDPGIEEYLYSEIKRGANNIDSLYLDFSFAKVYGNQVSQQLYYTGNATFAGLPVYDEASVQDLQSRILSDKEALTAVIAEFLGEDPGNFSVENIVVEESTFQQEADSASMATDDDGLPAASLAIVIVAACIGGIASAIICFVALKKPNTKEMQHSDDKPNTKELQPGGQNPTCTRSINVSTKEATPPEIPKEDLNKTLESEDDQLHDEFAQNMVNHEFVSSWKRSPVVHMQASVGRGSFHEISSVSVSEAEVPFDELENPEDLLGKQLSELQASVRAAKEKTQKLLEESKAMIQQSGSEDE